MARRLLLLSLFLVSLPAVADVNTDVANCLSTASNAPGAKGACVQVAITSEANRQASNLFQTYANNVNLGISYYGSTAGGNTPSSIGGGSGSTLNIQPAGAAAKPAAAAPLAPPAPPPPTATPPATKPAAPANQGGIQYY